MISAAFGADDRTNVALGKKVVTLPVVNTTAAFFSRITDGDVETFADWGDNWSDHTYVLIDLEKPEFIDHVRIYSGTTNNYTSAWVNLKPHFAVYAGETPDKLQFLAERKPFANYDQASLADAVSPFVDFSGLTGYGRYVAVFVRNYWGCKINEIEVTRGSGSRELVRPQATMSLEELWMRDASLSAWLQMNTEVVTPHVVWSAPSAVGTVRALFFTHMGQFRDIAELNQRMDLKWDWVPIIWNSTGDQPEVPAMTIVEEQKALNLLSHDWDVLMLGASVKWSDLPQSVRTAILAKVKSGTGLIYSNPLKECMLGDMDAVLSSLSSTPELQSRVISRFALDKVQLMKPLPEDMLSLGNHGSGSVALLRYENFLYREKLNFMGSAFLPEFGFYKTMPTPSENFYAFLIDLIYSVSARKPAVRIVSAKAENGVLEVAVEKGTSGC